ncbi:conjugal transfer protein TrbA [Escherichia coli]|nr:conjugal transfer protein TrbA [Escherichia coli]MDL7932318.1 conjugal transfer protein TrbA [Escherichia coli]HBN2623816.1 conjugal transfer protein TrbA [Escherichia coli]HCP9709427.1 conjugal transfer protein TrbA [Escherichia coli]HEA8559619.1 conjugal transfer protein TrbA [Escherichia coli]
MSEDYLKMFTGVVLLIFVIIVGCFFSERNDRKMFFLSSLVFLVINIACLYVLTARFWFLCGAIMTQGAAMVVSMVIGSLPNVTSFDRFRRIFVCIMLSSVWSGVMWSFINMLTQHVGK